MKDVTANDRMRILLVEDEQTIAVTLTDDLEAAGYEVRHCPDGQEGIAELQKRSYDVVITDVRLPGADGLQVLRYNTSRAYIAHLDYLDDNDSGHDYDSRHAGSNRFATILFYLSTPSSGGAKAPPPRHCKPAELKPKGVRGGAACVRQRLSNLYSIESFHS